MQFNFLLRALSEGSPLAFCLSPSLFPSHACGPNGWERGAIAAQCFASRMKEETWTDSRRFLCAPRLILKKKHPTTTPELNGGEEGEEEEEEETVCLQISRA